MDSQITLEVLVHGNSPHPIHHSERYDKYDDEDDDGMDWEIDHHTEGLTYVVLTLSKAAPMAGVALQWNIDPCCKSLLVKSVADQLLGLIIHSKKALDESHTMFREKGTRGDFQATTRLAVAPDAE